MKKAILAVNDFTKEELMDIINLSIAIKKSINSGYNPPLMKGMTLGMIFQQSSTRTRARSRPPWNSSAVTRSISGPA